MIVRSLEDDEIYDGLNLVKEVFFASGNLGFAKTGAKSFLEYVSAHGELLHYLGAWDKTLEGVLGYDDNFHIALFFVRSDRQNTGVGKALFQKLSTLAKAAAVSRISVNAAKPAVTFYEALGFEAYSEEETVDGIVFTPMEYLLQQDMLGKTVTVTIDRPYGSLHPHYPDTEYPCNYGYVEEVLAGDGEFQDAYVLGVYEPIEQFKGIVTAIIYRRDDCESKWVVTKDGNVTKKEVINAVGEIEQYFETRILWLEDHRMS